MMAPGREEQRMARRIGRAVARCDGTGIRRHELARQLGITETELAGYVGLAYAWRLVDCVRDYVVAQPVKPR